MTTFISRRELLKSMAAIGGVAAARSAHAVTLQQTPGAPLETLDEVGRVIGTTPATLAAT